jgi:hypothetical protein
MISLLPYVILSSISDKSNSFMTIYFTIGLKAILCEYNHSESYWGILVLVFLVVKKVIISNDIIWGTLDPYHKSNIWGWCTWSCGRLFEDLATMKTKIELQIMTNILAKTL